VYKKHQEKITNKQKQLFYKDTKKNLTLLLETKVTTENFFNSIKDKESFDIWYKYITNKLKTKSTYLSTLSTSKSTKYQNSNNNNNSNYYQNLQNYTVDKTDINIDITMKLYNMNENAPMETTNTVQNNESDDKDDDITLLNETIEMVKQQTAELLLTKATTAPSREEMMEKLQVSTEYQELDNYGTTEDGWKIQGMKSFKKEKRDTYKEVSEKYLPINLPLFESEIYVDTPTKYIIPITINIRQPRNAKCCI
jgi:hypothetical protein